MFPTFLITVREVIEASFIVATILGILMKLKQKSGIKTVWIATGAASAVSILLLAVGSILGLHIQEVYEKHEPYIEGVLMVISAIFITWAVFFLHTFFASYKARLLKRLKETVEQQEQKGLFILVFTAVFREGFEIALFLSTIYLSSNPQQIFIGFTGGLISGLLISFVLYVATQRMPVRYAFRMSSILLVLFAAGLLARGIHEFAEVGLLPEVGIMDFTFMPQKGTFVADIIKAVFGITPKMDLIQLSLYGLYILFMCWYIFFRKSSQSRQEIE